MIDYNAIPMCNERGKVVITKRGSEFTPKRVMMGWGGKRGVRREA